MKNIHLTSAIRYPNSRFEVRDKILERPNLSLGTISIKPAPGNFSLVVMLALVNPTKETDTGGGVETLTGVNYLR